MLLIFGHREKDEVGSLQEADEHLLLKSALGMNVGGEGSSCKAGLCPIPPGAPLVSAGNCVLGGGNEEDIGEWEDKAHWDAVSHGLDQKQSPGRGWGQMWLMG